MGLRNKKRLILLGMFLLMMLMAGSIVGADLSQSDVSLVVVSPTTANSHYTGGLYEPVAGIYFGASYEADSNVKAVDGARYTIEEINNTYKKKNSAYLMHLTFGESVDTIKTALDQADVADVGVVLVWETDEVYDNIGSYGDYIEDTISYLRWLDVPVFISYGAGMNVEDVDADLYVSNFRYVASKIRDTASDVAIVWTVDDGDTTNISDYYPGETYVDWIGVQSFVSPEDDPVSSIGEIIHNYGEDKPVMLTEVGVSRYDRRTGVDTTEWASQELGVMFNYIPMIYPQVKGVFLLNDRYENDSTHHYDIYSNEDMIDAYNDVVSDDALLTDIMVSGAYRYAVLESSKDPAVSIEDTHMMIRTLITTRDFSDYEVIYKLDGRKVSEQDQLPFAYDLQIKGMSDEKHNLSINVYEDGVLLVTKEFKILGNDDGALIESANYKVIDFSDIRGHWAEGYIIDVSKRGLVVGSDGVFRPYDLISRAEVTSIMTKLGKLEENGAVAFSDVASWKWYYKYVGNASRYLVGYGDAFYPERAATREEIITAMVKMKGYNLSDITTKDRETFAASYRDESDISSQYFDYMILASKYKIVGGYEDKTIQPKKSMTRGEVAKVLFTTFYE